MTEKTGLKAIVPSGKEVGLLVVQGFGLFLTVSGMIGMSFILGPLNHILKSIFQFGYLSNIINLVDIVLTAAVLAFPDGQ